VLDGKNLLFIEAAHTFYFSAKGLFETIWPAVGWPFLLCYQSFDAVHRFTQAPNFEWLNA
jgi:hypothetical protein